MVAFRRVIRHLLMTVWHLRRAFPAPVLARIEERIRVAETAQEGELRFVVEAALDVRDLWRGTSARERAIEVFSQLRVWDTEQNNGVLIYILLADRDVEIVADRGICRRAGRDAWESICRDMERAFAAGHFEAGALQGIEAVSALLARHFPPTGLSGNELPDRPVLL